MTDAQRNELQALLVRAAASEAQRQAAHARGDTLAEHAAEDELRAAWRRHTELERHA